MISPRRRLAIRGVIFIALVGLLFFFSHYIPQPFTALMPPGEDFDDFEGIYSSSDKLSKFLQSLGPYSPAVFVLLQILQVVAAPFPGNLPASPEDTFTVKPWVLCFPWWDSRSALGSRSNWQTFWAGPLWSDLLARKFSTSSTF